MKPNCLHVFDCRFQCRQDNIFEKLGEESVIRGLKIGHMKHLLEGVKLYKSGPKQQKITKFGFTKKNRKMGGNHFVFW